LVLGFGALLLMLWGNKGEQFDDSEGAKYRIMDDDDEK
jgi:cbb3-type cytochrome oxidase maturation protein